MPCPLLIFSQSHYMIQIVGINSHNDKQCRSRLVGFFRSQLIWIFTVCKVRVYLGSAGQGLITCWVKNVADDILKYFSYFSQKIRFDISCKLSPKEKCLEGLVFCSHSLKSCGLKLESHWKWNSTYDCVVLHCVEPCIIVLPSYHMT